MRKGRRLLLKHCAALPTELGREGILIPTPRAAILDQHATVMTKLHALGIVESTACTAHAASLLLYFSRGKKNILCLPLVFSSRDLVTKVAGNGGARDVHPEERHSLPPAPSPQ